VIYFNQKEESINFQDLLRFSNSGELRNIHFLSVAHCFKSLFILVNQKCKLVTKNDFLINKNIQ
jgi:hypothetical protein